MRLSQNHIDFVAFLVLKALKEAPRVEVLDADAVVRTVRQEITANLRAEQDLEREAEAMLAPHKAQILREGADYQKMLRDGMKTLAKKKGLVL